MGEDSEIGVPGVPQTFRQAGTGHKIVSQVDVIGGRGEGGPEQLDDAGVVAAVENGEPVPELARLDRAAEFALEDDHVLVSEGATPGGGVGVGLGEEVVGGGADLGEAVEVGVFGEGLAEAGERGSAEG